MMKLTRKTTIQAALSAVLLLGAAAPTQAQGLVSCGSGTYESPSNPESTSRFAYCVTEQANGAILGPLVGDLTTIQQIVKLLPFFPPPVWAQLTRGNVFVR